ncbi:hypothetical protein [Mesorhizobium sp. B2-3-4]|uniref:hypothetical protein n=1 Tax=Mesorhizobium sp. B2-3-4 TaxID=2589959 RepID=UPI00112B0756|nr:hypothetical protein [Mesorhizobium sp. B2-3-4]TPM39564.1 hypothetical protein FJ967_08755 [Mesorhizobium sp. B2-3-4]
MEETSEMLKSVARAIGTADGHSLTEADYLGMARAAIEAMRDPSFEMMRAMYEAMFVDRWDGSQAPMIGAGFEAAISAALSPSTRGE